MTDTPDRNEITSNGGAPDPADLSPRQWVRERTEKVIDRFLALRPQGKAAIYLCRLNEKATPEQLDALTRLGYGDLSLLSKGEAAQLIREERAASRERPATERQERQLRKKGLWRDGMTRGEAGSVLYRAWRADAL